jgi:hypothetical protein
LNPRIAKEIAYWRKISPILNRTVAGKAKGTRGCRIWKGRTVTDEWGFYKYGRCTYNGKACPAHRVIWEHHYGPLGKDFLVNLCGNTLCVAPDHWERRTHPRAKKRVETPKD